MSAIKGTVRLTGMISPKDTEDTYPTHEDTYGKGGHRSVATLEDRDNISDSKKKRGMTVYVENEDSTFILKDDWEEMTSNADDVSESIASIGILIHSNTADITKIKILGVNH